MKPNQPDKMVPADDDATPINDPDHDSICDFSKTTHENTGWVGVPTVCENVHTQPNALKSGDRNLLKKKEPGNRAEQSKGEGLWKQKQEDESSNRQAIGNKCRVVAKTKMKDK